MLGFQKKGTVVQDCRSIFIYRGNVDKKIFSDWQKIIVKDCQTLTVSPVTQLKVIGFFRAQEIKNAWLY